MCGSTYPTLSNVVAVYNLHLDKMEGYSSGNANMENANQAAYLKLKKYYTKFDDAHVYNIATSKSLLPSLDFDNIFLIYMCKSFTPA